MSTPTEIANRVVPEYETLKAQGGLTGRVAERWAVAFEAAELALRPVADSDGWIEHDGSEAPNLPFDTVVQVRFRDGTQDKVPHWTIREWHSDNPSGNNFLWLDDSGSEIIAYRVVSP